MSQGGTAATELKFTEHAETNREKSTDVTDAHRSTASSSRLLQVWPRLDAVIDNLRSCLAVLCDLGGFVPSAKSSRPAKKSNVRSTDETVVVRPPARFVWPRGAGHGIEEFT